MARSHDPAKSETSTVDRVEYVVRPNNDSWMIEHDGDHYGPYKNSREAMYFAIDAACTALSAFQEARPENQPDAE